MAFNKTKFIKQKFQSRVESVSVPALESWFDDNEKDELVWKVRGMTGHEIAKLREITTTDKNMTSIIEAIGSSDREKIAELRKVMGLSEDTTNDLRIRLEQLVMGSVEPEIDSSVAVRLAETFPTTFYTLTDKITQLTAMGMDVKK